MTTAKTIAGLPPEAFRFHRKPWGKSRQRCPVCGLRSNKSGLHRRATPSDGERVGFVLRLESGRDKLIMKPHTNRESRKGISIGRLLQKAITDALPHSPAPRNPEKIGGKFFELASRHQQELAKKDWGTQQAHIRSVGRFAKFLGREPKLSDLNMATIDRFNLWLEINDCANQGGLGGKCCLLALWRFGSAVGIVADSPPRKRNCRPNLAKEFLEKPFPQSTPDMRLLDYARVYAMERGLSTKGVRNLIHTVNSLAKHLERPADLTDLSTETINEWIFSLQQAGLSAHTITARRTGILGLWRQAAEADLLPAPKRIRPVKCPATIPRCFSPQELLALLAHVATMDGTLRRGVRVCDFWRALILVAFYSGLRLGDLCRLPFTAIGPNGAISVVQGKTGDVVECKLRPEAIEAIQATSPPARRLIFGDVLSADRVKLGFRQIVRDAGISRGSLKWLRRSGATFVEATTPGASKAFLGHRTPGLAYKSYVDPRFIQQNRVVPPSLEELVGMFPAGVSN